MKRREFMFAIATVSSPWVLTSSAQPALRPVKLLVLRRLGLSPTNQCIAPCIRGQVFNVSDRAEPLDTITLASLVGRTALCDVIERPFQGNAANKSSIPRGIYTATIRTDPTKPWMKNADGSAIANRAWRLELANTNPRSAIQFHYGQDVSWSNGCLIVGTALQSGDAAGITDRYCRVDSGEAAVAALRAAVAAPGNDLTKITIGIGDEGGLFANLAPTAPC